MRSSPGAAEHRSEVSDPGGEKVRRKFKDWLDRWKEMAAVRIVGKINSKVGGGGVIYVSRTIILMAVRLIEVLIHRRKVCHA